jgi:hypothetical protein
MRQFLTFTGIVFTVVCAAWLSRLILGFPIAVNGYSVPVSWSVVPVLITGALALWAFRLLRNAKA